MPLGVPRSIKGASAFFIFAMAGNWGEIKTFFPLLFRWHKNPNLNENFDCPFHPAVSINLIFVFNDLQIREIEAEMLSFQFGRVASSVSE